MSETTNDFNALNPVEGERILIDVFGTGNFSEFVLLKVKERHFKAKWLHDNDDAIVTIKVFDTKTDRANHAFWRSDYDNILHYQLVRKVQ